MGKKLNLVAVDLDDGRVGIYERVSVDLSLEREYDSRTEAEAYIESQQRENDAYYPVRGSFQGWVAEKTLELGLEPDVIKSMLT